MLVVVVRLSVHVHFNLGLSPRDSGVPGQRPPVCFINLTVCHCGWVGLTNEDMLDIMWCHAAVYSHVLFW